MRSQMNKKLSKIYRKSLIKNLNKLGFNKRNAPMLKDLRSFLKLLEEKGDLVHITEPVSARFEIAAGIRKTSDIQGPALWFDNVFGSSMPVVGMPCGAARFGGWKPPSLKSMRRLFTDSRTPFRRASSRMAPARRLF